MNKYILFLFLILFLNLSHTHPFSEDVKNAVLLLKQQKTTILQIKSTSQTEGDEALAIAFPEVLRWNAFSDYLETTALELIYIQSGSNASNFSIGYFQMKPSFVEKLENYVSTHEALKIFNYIVINQKVISENRKERVLRMKQFAWQMRYTHVFWAVAQDKFKHRVFKKQEDRVRFFATAYNYGFHRPEKEIEERLNKAIFPYGVSYKGQQVAYGDLAIEFLTKYAIDFR